MQRLREQMIQLRYSLDYSRLPGMEPKPIAEEQRVFENFLYETLRSLYPKGLGPRDLRTLDRILQKLDSSQGEIELEAAEFELVKDAFENQNCRLDPKCARIVAQYRRAIESAGVGTE